MTVTCEKARYPQTTKDCIRSEKVWSSEVGGGGQLPAMIIQNAILFASTVYAAQKEFCLHMSPISLETEEMCIVVSVLRTCKIPGSSGFWPICVLFILQDT